MSINPPHDPSRRSFLKHSSAAVVGASLLGLGATARSQDADEHAGHDHGQPARGADTELKIALIGCGGRGTGAAAQALRTAGPVKLVAMADAFEDRLETSRTELLKLFDEQVIDVPEARRFVGFDAYRQAMDEDVDVVILATPPGFRPQHFAHAVYKNKHVFMEKPVAVDAPGVRTVMAASDGAYRKNLKVGVGLQRHHDKRYDRIVHQIHEGAIGDVVLLRCYWNSDGVWVREREPDMTEMEYQMRNWYYFNWLCGDHIVEQHIHNLDVCNWIKDGHPTEAQGQGGRQVRTGKQYGEIFDHHMIEYTYEDGSKMLSQCRHIRNTWNSVSEHAHGTLGTADVSRGTFVLRDGTEWSYGGEQPNPYQREHDHLFAAIRHDRPYNEAQRGAIATMTAILGRMATYSGQRVTWDEALASELTLAPGVLAWDADPKSLPDDSGNYVIPVPGVSTAL